MHRANWLVCSYSYSYRVTLFQQQLFSEESCSVGLSEKMGFQLRSKLSATVVRWTEVGWTSVLDDRSSDGKTSLVDGHVCLRNEQVAAVSWMEWPTWQVRDWADDLLEVDRTSTSDTVKGQSSNLELDPCSDWQPVTSVTNHRCNVQSTFVIQHNWNATFSHFSNH